MPHWLQNFAVADKFLPHSEQNLEAVSTLPEAREFNTAPLGTYMSSIIGGSTTSRVIYVITRDMDSFLLAGLVTVSPSQNANRFNISSGVEYDIELVDI